MPEQRTQRCVACGGALVPAITTLTLESNCVAVNFDHVPCLRCLGCSEEEFDGPLAAELGKVAEAFFKTGAMVATLPEPIRHVRVDVGLVREPVAV